MDNKSSNIDIKSLRIGSHVMWNDKRRRVDAITEYSIAFRIADSERKEYDSATIEQIEPIAITPELLKELGFQFRKSAGGSWCISDKKGGYFYATVCSDSTCVVTHYPDFGFQSRVVCTYLHELEAFAYLIAKTELIPD